MTLWRKGDAVAPDSRKASWAESDSRTRKIFQRNCPLQSTRGYESALKARSPEIRRWVAKTPRNGTARAAKSVLFWLKSNLLRPVAQRPSRS